MSGSAVGLTEPVRLAGRAAPSRVLFGPHETNLGDGRALSGAHAAHYAERAAGGAGVVVTEVASAHGSDWPYERAPLAAECGPGWAAVVAACRPHGTLVLAGLGHAGSQGSSARSQSALWAPSRVADVASRELPMAVEPREIRALLAGFATAARIAVESDVDGVEIGAGQFSLLRQFLSGLTNQRADEYGTDRSRLLREVLAAVRAERGAGRVLGLRLSCDELAPWAGITPEQGAELAAALAPEVDYLAVVRGSAMGTAATTPDAHAEPGFNRELCRAVREAVAGAAPVVLQGSVVDPAQAQAALDDGTADLVEMTRAQLADPALVRKVRAGRRVRPCTLTNQQCRVRDDRNPLVSCLGEPRTGHETTDPVPGGTGDGRPVLVAGGGPAGLEAARVLALRGHPVRLVERTDRLGGMLALAALLPGRGRLGALVDWLVAEVRELGVPITTGADARPEPGEFLVAATGSASGPRHYESAGTVLEAADLLRAVRDGRLDLVVPDGPVAVFDPVGDATGVAVAELLAATGREVSIISQDPVIGTQLARTGDLADANARLQRAGVVLAKRSALRAVRPGDVLLADVFTGAERTLPAELVVHCGHRLPDPAPPPDFGTTVGDRVAPRTAHEAVREGRRAAFALVRDLAVPA
ncbi:MULTISPECIES: mycofactocin system FadH/OYE family oxidoreductase 1 [unclassified Saccharopolyspora]|uniref:mycofactocin system FadH/OYE family oxidoreductase 1 n=1 Tax=unclassified Saccharopolyspora TaxID=2646250 RepID=UPI001CD74C0A|nr:MULTISPECIES: mycofactocin system FadH/OYE family oxidoreductase 1 [unclassified Saccharopolyspora]MCA1185375.1 mycofactocin system FadH/OYE family oxidoreductase 1 [Saccharopolyspora sp. 6T]MCA1279360.1 mycofactocin system FadH/OYE family oxidoreductase 1 [Saccharopolyspora sp. 7B]